MTKEEMIARAGKVYPGLSNGEMVRELWIALSEMQEHIDTLETRAHKAERELGSLTWKA